MKYKSLLVFLIISSFFLTCILSIWKIMSTLQGLSFNNLNLTTVFLIGIRIPIKKTVVRFKLLKLRPCKVDMIFQIDKIHVRKKEDMIKNTKRDLYFICPLSY